MLQSQPKSIVRKFVYAKPKRGTCNVSDFVNDCISHYGPLAQRKAEHVFLAQDNQNSLRWLPCYGLRRAEPSFHQ
jgi:hypothetical protein